MALAPKLRMYYVEGDKNDDNSRSKSTFCSWVGDIDGNDNNVLTDKLDTISDFGDFDKLTEKRM